MNGQKCRPRVQTHGPKRQRQPRPCTPGPGGQESVGAHTLRCRTPEFEEGKMEIPEGVKAPRAESPKAARRNQGPVGKSPILAGDESRDPNRCFHE